MPPKRKPTPFAQDIVQRLKIGIQDADRLDNLTLSHRIPVISPVGGESLVFTVDITLGPKGRFCATCREFPGFFVTAESEQDVLKHAERQILQRLADGRT